MVVNACCHRAYNIRGTEIQIKMFDDRTAFESPGRLPGMVRPSNIRYTHFSRNPKIAAFLKAYHYVKEYGEGVDRMCRELEVNGSVAPVFHTDDFILKVTVAKVTEKLPENSGKLTENKIAILTYMTEDPYISKSDLSKFVGISTAAISNNIEAMRGKYLRRVGPDKGGFWEIIE